MKYSKRILQSSKDQITFRHWTNKPYAVFNSLKRIIKIAVLNVIYSLLTIGSATSFAQEDSLRVDKKLDLDEIEVVSTAEPLVFNQQARIISLVSKKDILQSPQDDIAGILSKLRALDIRERGGFGVQSDVSIRGSSFDQVLILLNGIAISDPQTGHFNLNLPIVSQAIERIEVLEGSAARVYGANAFAGAINIVTQPSDRNKIQIKTEGGQNAYYSLGAAINFASRRSRTFLSLQKSASDGYMENTDFRLNNLFFQSIWIANNFNIDIQFGLQQKQFGANGFYSAKYPLQYEYNKAYTGSVNLNFGRKLISKMSLFWRQHQDQWVLTREDPSIYQNFHQTGVYGLKTTHRFISALGKTQLGTEIKSESIWSSSLGETQQELKPVPWDNAYYFSRYYKRTNESVFLDHQVQFGTRFYTGFGFLVNWNSEYAQDVKIYPGIDMSYTYNSTIKIIASLNQAMRLPTFTDLYYSGPANLGNANLLPENATSFEVGLKFQKNDIQADALYFSRLGKNTIDWVWLEEIGKWQTENIIEQRVSGIETSLNYTPSGSGLLESAYLNYTYLNSISKEIPELTKYASTHLKHQLNLGASIHLLSHLYTSFSLSYRDRVGNYQTYDFVNLQYHEVAYKTVLLTDVKLRYEQNQYTLYAEGLNLFNQKYFEYGVLQAGIWFKAGISINLEAKK